VLFQDAVFSGSSVSMRIQPGVVLLVNEPRSFQLKKSAPFLVAQVSIDAAAIEGNC
jgi:hypothetical protein